MRRERREPVGRPEFPPTAPRGRGPGPGGGRKAKRRRFTAEYRLRCSAKLERCRGLVRSERCCGVKGCTPRSCPLAAAAEEGALEGLRARKRGPKAKAVDPRVKKLEQENARLVRKLKKAEAIIAFQKKVHRAPGDPPETVERDEDD